MVGKRKRVAGLRTVTTISLTQEAADKINAFVDRRGGHGMKKHLLSRLVDWFANQPDAVKSVTVGWIDEGMEHAYAAALRKLADEIESKREPVGVIR